MSRNKLRIHSGDTVKVVAGRDKGKIGKVLRVIPETRRVVVEGVAVVTRHQKPVGEQPGAIIRKEASIDISNVAFWDAAEGSVVKVGFADVEGAKVRVNRKTGAALDAGGEA